MSKAMHFDNTAVEEIVDELKIATLSEACETLCQTLPGKYFFLAIATLNLRLSGPQRSSAFACVCASLAAVYPASQRSAHDAVQCCL